MNERKVKNIGAGDDGKSKMADNGMSAQASDNNGNEDEKNAIIMRASALKVGFGRRLVLDGLSIEQRRGEILGVVGGSGSGKSVLLRTIIGLLPRRAGRLELFGQDVDRLDDEQRQLLERRWGVMFQQGALFSSLTVRQNVQFQMRESLDVSQRLLDEMADARLAMVGLDPLDGDKAPSELSGGMTKRAALARALALDPEFVLLDEPTSGLDPLSAREFDRLIRALQESLNLTVFMVTHDLESLFAICDRIAVLAEGRMVETGSLADMLASKHPWVRRYFRAGRQLNRAIDAIESN
jgi:phospholipid/cholesterol/gamma-HCH transport system ATP-binding protein